MTDEEKGVVHRFTPPGESPLGKFEKAFDGWLAQHTETIENGRDEDFAKIRDGLAETALMYGQNERQHMLSVMAAEFERRRSNWQTRAESAAMEEFKDANAAVSLRYAELSHVINKLTQP